MAGVLRVLCVLVKRRFSPPMAGFATDGRILHQWSEIVTVGHRNAPRERDKISSVIAKLSASEWATIIAATASACAAIAGAASAIAAWRAAKASRAIARASERKQILDDLKSIHGHVQYMITLDSPAGGFTNEGARMAVFGHTRRDLRAQLLTAHRSLPKCSELASWTGQAMPPDQLRTDALAEVETAIEEEGGQT
jgi:hypothetical protein